MDPIHQGLGIGKALVKAGLDRLKNQSTNGCVVVGRRPFVSVLALPNTRVLKLGIPPEYYMAMTFAENIPVGTVAYHAAFGAVEQKIVIRLKALLHFRNGSFLGIP